MPTIFTSKCRSLFLGTALSLLAMLLPPGDSQPSTQTEIASSADQVVHTLCREQIVLLGENPVHGFANTLDFKVNVVHRLVDECHFDALYFEAGTYDFIQLERAHSSGQPVTDSMISAAIGGLWANEETQALVPFLREKVESGALRLGGMDDQLGAGSWASRDMSSDLIQPLEGEEKSRCKAVFERHLLWQYTDDAPYGPVDKQKILACLDAVKSKLTAGIAKTSSAEQSRVMTESLQRNLARNFTEDDFSKKDQVLKWMNDRDRSMYMNFNWLRSQMPANSKIIVWVATVHTAKNLSGISGFEGRVSLGSYIHQEEGQHAFSLGFSAYSGNFSFRRQSVKALSDAPESSLEAQIYAHNEADSLYLSPERLRKLPCLRHVF